MMIIVMAQLFLNDVIMTINDKKKLITIYDNDVDRIIVIYVEREFKQHVLSFHFCHKRQI